MELKIINKTEDEMHLEIKGETHTLLNMLKSVLLEDTRVRTASYDMKHVSISEPILYIKTDGTDPITIVREAAETLITQCDEFLSVFGKAVEV
ncbi:MAG: DNA-directed RNA polymerase subunit L [Methanomethylovorans sp.]|uniref:DNA-directed RNA polymerase subunit L n=1 Tax=Methanomethylovorans sp. TaxID=2758717 RepID=UPI000A963893|nr:DNA-directed RNA polymerase subunit L [Methanomethylovorans sp.]